MRSAQGLPPFGYGPEYEEIPPSSLATTDPEISDDHAGNEYSNHSHQIEPEHLDLSEINVVLDSPDFVHILSSRGLFLFVSPAFTEKVLEYTPNDIVGKNLSHFCHPGDAVSVMRELKMSDVGQPISVLYRLKRQHSGYIWIEVTGHKYEMENRKKTKCFVLSGRVRDLGHLPHQSLVEPGETLAESPDFWAKLSVDGLILYVSPSSSSPFDIKNEALYGKSLLDLLSTSSRSELSTALKTIKDTPILLKVHTNDTSSDLWIHLFPGDAPTPHFLFVKIYAQEPPSALSTTAVYPSASLSVDVFSNIHADRPTGLQFELNRLKAGNKQLQDEIANLKNRHLNQ